MWVKNGMRVKNDELVFDLLNFEEPLYLHELAILALAIHELHESHLFMSSNGYHYAGTILKILGTRVQLTECCGRCWSGGKMARVRH